MTQSGFWTSMIFVCLLFFFNSKHVQAQFNFLGKPGLVMTPKPGISDEKEYFYLGTSYVPKKFALNNFVRRIDEEDYFVGNLDFASRVRINAVLTRPRNIDRIGIGDRHLDVQVDLIYQRGWLPNVGVVITPEFNGSASLNHNAILLSRYFDLSKDFRLEFSGGYGLPVVFMKPFRGLGLDETKFQWVDKALLGNHYLNDFFGGVQLSAWNSLWITAEYDGRFYNASASVLLFKSLHFQTRLLGLEAFSYGFGYRFLLKD
ncbi:YjbH domain-containing protein [Rhodonellum sp.]|uniref:YjbH domain-containing protein n=1 Tax=Rhodonellum sp. TaxID=2231180 RepID=UPI00271BEB6A|nr:YjbH domain-containing protein [Rhodonellum sp.]MDO9554925.1 YjbH domain-containing protein [Rhodonellum sp.]